MNWQLWTGIWTVLALIAGVVAWTNSQRLLTTFPFLMALVCLFIVVRFESLGFAGFPFLMAFGLTFLRFGTLVALFAYAVFTTLAWLVLDHGVGVNPGNGLMLYGYLSTSTAIFCVVAYVFELPSLWSQAHCRHPILLR